MRSYLDGHDGFDPLESPLNADLARLPPLSVHVGYDEVLLDDSVRFVERAVAAGVDARVDVWEGMVHGFTGAVGRLSASTESLQIGEFLAERFAIAHEVLKIEEQLERALSNRICLRVSHLHGTVDSLT